MCSHHIRAGWAAAARPQVLTLGGCACSSDPRRSVAPELPSQIIAGSPLPYGLARQLPHVGSRVGCGFIWTANLMDFSSEKVPEACGLWMGRFVLGRLRHVQHIVQSRACNRLQHTPPRDTVCICVNN